jgi:inorganic pyrophosphatase
VDDPQSPGPVEMIVEIPAGTRNKYEFDEATGALHLDRELPAHVAYPADYGYIPGTLAEDGDALDALVILDEPAVPGCIVRILPLGVLWVTDEKGRDPKVISVLAGDAERRGHQQLEDLPAHVLAEIEHFFSVYKDLEEGRSATTQGFAGREEAEAQIIEARQRYLANKAG